MEEDDGADSLPQLKKESELPFVPNYLANPAFPFIYTPAAEDPGQLQNGGTSTPPASPPADGSPPLLPTGEPPLAGAFPRDHTSLALVQNRDVSAPSAILRTPESTKPGPVCQPPVSQSRSLFSSVPTKPPVSLESQNGTYAGPTPAFQPFFFTGAFPFNMQGKPEAGSSRHCGAAGVQRSSDALPRCWGVEGCMGGGIYICIENLITDSHKVCKTGIRSCLYSDSQMVYLLPFYLDIGVYFLRTRMVSYVTTVRRSSLGNVTLL